jgi:hypothetical protein
MVQKFVPNGCLSSVKKYKYLFLLDKFIVQKIGRGIKSPLSGQNNDYSNCQKYVPFPVKGVIILSANTGDM